MTLSTDPGLFPRFERGIPDYVVRCGDTPVTVSASAPAGSTIAIDGDMPQTGQVSRRVRLSAGQAFQVAVADGLDRHVHHVRCLTEDMPDWIVKRGANPRTAFYLLSPSLFDGARYVLMFDSFGVPIWWLRTATLTLDAKLLSDNTVAYARFFGNSYGIDPGAAYEIRRLDGSLARTVTAVGNPIDHHDLVEVGNGDLLVLAYRPREHVDLSPFGGPADATIVDGEIQQIAPDGSLVWSWNSGDHVPLAETGRWWPVVLSTGLPLPAASIAYDPFHINAISIRGDQLLVSARHADAIYAIDRESGSIGWKLGGTTRPESLSVAGGETSLFGGQHDVRALDDGTITVYDNATNLPRPPRAVRFELHLAARTATIVESLSDPAITSSACCGSARMIPGGGWLVGWGRLPELVEYDANGGRQLSIAIDGGFSYRSIPVSPEQVTRGQLRAAMDTRHPRD